MTRSLKVWLIVLTAAVLVVAPSCRKKPAEVETTPVEVAQPAVEPTPPPPPPPVEVKPDNFPTRTDPIEEPQPTIAELNRDGVLQTIHFDFDRSDLTSNSQMTLRRNADWMKNNRQYSVVVQGHCDSRGTIEYNLALGQRRANTVREFLSGQGVPLSRLRTVTYGEERPVTRGNNESAWSRNRRAEFVIEP